MLPSLLLCIFLVSVSVMTHYEVLRLLNDRLNSTDLISTRAKVLAALVGALRMICGIESLIGLLMVSWTASFTYLVMRRYW